MRRWPPTVTCTEIQRCPFSSFCLRITRKWNRQTLSFTNIYNALRSGWLGLIDLHSRCISHSCTTSSELRYHRQVSVEVSTTVLRSCLLSASRPGATKRDRRAHRYLCANLDAPRARFKPALSARFIIRST